MKRYIILSCLVFSCVMGAWGCGGGGGKTLVNCDASGCVKVEHEEDANFKCDEKDGEFVNCESLD